MEVVAKENAVAGTETRDEQDAPQTAAATSVPQNALPKKPKHRGTVILGFSEDENSDSDEKEDYTAKVEPFRPEDLKKNEFDEDIELVGLRREMRRNVDFACYTYEFKEIYHDRIMPELERMVKQGWMDAEEAILNPKQAVEEHDSDEEYVEQKRAYLMELQRQRALNSQEVQSEGGDGEAGREEVDESSDEEEKQETSREESLADSMKFKPQPSQLFEKESSVSTRPARKFITPNVMPSFHSIQGGLQQGLRDHVIKECAEEEDVLVTDSDLDGLSASLGTSISISSGLESMQDINENNTQKVVEMQKRESHASSSTPKTSKKEQIEIQVSKYPTNMVLTQPDQLSEHDVSENDNSQPVSESGHQTAHRRISSRKILDVLPLNLKKREKIRNVSPFGILPAKEQQPKNQFQSQLSRMKTTFFSKNKDQQVFEGKPNSRVARQHTLGRKDTATVQQLAYSDKQSDYQLSNNSRMSAFRSNLGLRTAQRQFVKNKSPSVMSRGKDSVLYTMSDITDEKFKESFEKRLIQIRQAYDRKLREMKPFIMTEAASFLKLKAIAVTQLLSRQHHKVVQQFIDFKNRTRDSLRKAERQHFFIANLETRLAMKSPTMEAEFAIDEASALSLYDCLVPKLKEHRRFKILKDSLFSIADFKAQIKIRELQYKLEQKRLPQALEENELLRDKVAELEEEVGVVRWYIETMERGIDTKDVTERYCKLIKEHERLTKTTTKQIAKLSAENERLKNELKDALAQLKKQQEEIVKPLIAEVVRREKQNQKLHKDCTDRNRNLKILFAMIRSPKLCNMVYCAERKRYTKEKMEQIHESSVLTLRQYKYEPDNADVFVNQVHREVHALLEDPDYNSPRTRKPSPSVKPLSSLTIQLTPSRNLVAPVMSTLLTSGTSNSPHNRNVSVADLMSSKPMSAKSRRTVDAASNDNEDQRSLTTQLINLIDSSRLSGPLAFFNNTLQAKPQSGLKADGYKRFKTDKRLSNVTQLVQPSSPEQDRPLSSAGLAAVRKRLRDERKSDLNQVGQVSSMTVCREQNKKIFGQQRKMSVSNPNDTFNTVTERNIKVRKFSHPQPSSLNLDTDIEPIYGTSRIKISKKTSSIRQKRARYVTPKQLVIQKDQVNFNKTSVPLSGENPILNSSSSVNANSEPRKVAFSKYKNAASGSEPSDEQRKTSIRNPSNQIEVDFDESSSKQHSTLLHSEASPAHF